MRVIGDRIPGLWLTKGQPKLYVGTALGNRVNYLHITNKHFPLHTWTDVEINQIRIESKIMLVIRVNGTVVHQVENTIPQTFVNVRVYASDGFHDPAVARIRRLKYGNLPDGEFFLT